MTEIEANSVIKMTPQAQVEIPRDICLRILLVREQQARLNAERRASEMELEILKRECIDTLGIDLATNTVHIDPERGVATVRERLAPPAQ